jgi:putative intracellular protease/amidase
MPTPKLLAILTSMPTLGPNGPANGTFFPEIAHALHAVHAAGIAYDIASPKGGAVPWYGEDAADALSAEMAAQEPFQAALKASIKLSSINAAGYSAVFLPGGYGLLWDLVDDADSQRIIAETYAGGGVVSAVCHGPAALLNVRQNADLLIKNRRVTGFTREEEIEYGTIDAIPFLLEERLMASGGVYSKVASWQEHVEVDDRLITGQNPASAHAVGSLTAKMIAKY